MWAWRPSVHRKYWVGAQLVGGIVLAHLMLLLHCFLLEQSKSIYRLNINKNLMNSSLPVVFLPFQEAGFAQPRSRQASAKKKSSAPKKAAKVAKQEMAKTKKVAEVVKTKTVVLSQKEKKQTQKKDKKELVAQKKVAPTPIEKPIAKEIEKKLAAAKEEKAEKKIVENKVPVAPLAQPEEVKEVATAIDALYVGRADLDQLAVQDAIQNVFAANWRPPVGLSPELACHIKFMVNAKGEIQEMAMVESSGVLIYDLAVQMAIRESALHLPICAHGKEFSLTFTQ